ncbi:hypothetical protein ACF3M1_09640 [Luteimonas sp. WGS1318]|uniref:hypothetical protein n=1 Tax=Luteimonas sp. WGS1318 TaxID=3366815 RepID=UPI00372D11CA
MNTTGDHARSHLDRPVPTTVVESTALPASDSAVSWAAILAGAAAAAALSLILLILGTGLGLSSVSPWSFEGISAETFGWTTIAWITFTAIAASGLGGYLTGRLRTRWVSVHGDETYFRDTAHGFLSWAVATLVTAAVLTSAIGAILGTATQAVGSAAGAATGTAATAVGGIAAAGDASSERGNGLEYWVDSLFRRDAAPVQTLATAPSAGMGDGAMQPAAATPVAANANANASDDPRPEVARIFVNGLRFDTLDPADARYVAQRIAERTGLSQQEAEARVTEVHTRMRAALDDAETTARETADEARKASAYAAMWLFITLLIGAFSASLLATFGGRQRDL